MIRYRIYTEDKPCAIARIEALVTAEFPGFTIYRGTGYWHGVSEHNLTIEILTPERENGKIAKIALAIKALLQQEAVLVTSEATEATLL